MLAFSSNFLSSSSVHLLLSQLSSSDYQTDRPRYPFNHQREEEGREALAIIDGLNDTDAEIAVCINPSGCGRREDSWLVFESGARDSG